MNSLFEKIDLPMHERLVRLMGPHQEHILDRIVHFNTVVRLLTLQFAFSVYQLKNQYNLGQATSFSLCMIVTESIQPRVLPVSMVKT